MSVVAYIFFCLGGLICVVNFYLSFLRYPFYRLTGGDKENYRWVSGIPVFGSIFVVISLVFLYKIKWALISGMVFIAADTGGFHWFLGTMFYYGVLKKEPTGIRPDYHIPHWEVSCPKDYSCFFGALIDLIPHGAIAYFEGSHPRKELETFFADHSVPEVSHVAAGIIWPRSQKYHVPATRDNLSTLAKIAQNYAEPVVAIHFHVYKDKRVLLEWHDAFSDPMLISKEIPEDKIKAFCDKLSVTYKTKVMPKS
jgi:hypothetical protein